MTSYQYLMPGKKGNCKRLVKYNYYYQNACNSFEVNYKQLKTAENDPNSVSNTLRISNLILNNIGGKTRFGNTYLNIESQPFIDLLGSVEGQPGGSYRPLRNRF